MGRGRGVSPDSSPSQKESGEEAVLLRRIVYSILCVCVKIKCLGAFRHYGVT